MQLHELAENIQFSNSTKKLDKEHNCNNVVDGIVIHNPFYVEQ